MSQLYKKTLPLALLSLVTIMILSSFFIVSEPLSNISSTLTSWGVIVIALAIGVGVINLTKHHIRFVADRKGEQWIFSAVLLVIMYTTLIF